MAAIRTELTDYNNNIDETFLSKLVSSDVCETKSDGLKLLFTVLNDMDYNDLLYKIKSITNVDNDEYKQFQCFNERNNTSTQPTKLDNYNQLIDDKYSVDDCNKLSFYRTNTLIHSINLLNIGDRYGDTALNIIYSKYCGFIIFIMLSFSFCSTFFNVFVEDTNNMYWTVPDLVVLLSYFIYTMLLMLTINL
eukprot:96242_1